MAAPDDEHEPLGVGEVVVVRTGDVSEVAVRGEIDIATSPAFDDAVAEALDGGATTLVLDLGDVSFIGSSGLASLLRAQRLLRERGGRLELRSPSRAVCDLLEMTRLTERFGVERVAPVVEPVDLSVDLSANADEPPGA